MIEGAAFMAIHACSLGAPILLEEGKATGKTPTVKNVATSSTDMMKAKGLWNTAWDPFFGLTLCGPISSLRPSGACTMARLSNRSSSGCSASHWTLLSYAGAGHHAAAAGSSKSSS